MVLIASQTASVMVNHVLGIFDDDFPLTVEWQHKLDSLRDHWSIFNGNLYYRSVVDRQIPLTALNNSNVPLLEIKACVYIIYLCLYIFNVFWLIQIVQMVTCSMPVLKTEINGWRCLLTVFVFLFLYSIHQHWYRWHFRFCFCNTEVVVML